MNVTKTDFQSQLAGYRSKRRRRGLLRKIIGVLACAVVFGTTYALILPAITMVREDSAAAAQVVPEASYSVCLYNDPSSAGTVWIDLQEDARVQLEVSGGAGAYQWQIWSAETGAWLDIYGDDGQSCDLYYAKLKNVLSGGEARLRATASVGGEQWFSDTVTVSVQALQQPEEVAEPVILDEGSPSPEGAYLGSDPEEPVISDEDGWYPEDTYPQSGPAEPEEPVISDEENWDSDDTYALSEPSEPEEPVIWDEEAAQLQSESPQSEPLEDANLFEPADDAGGETSDEDGARYTGGEPENNWDIGETEPGAGGAFSDPGSSDGVGEDLPDEGEITYSEQSRYEVRVRYQYESGAAATDPWWATFSSTGATGNYQVTFPTIQGYKVKRVAADDGSVPILVHASDGSITGLILPEYVQADLNYTVVYEADTVSYTVSHYLQRLDDPTQYDLQETETKSGLTGALLRDDAKSYTGFSQVAYQYPTLAADGGTEVKIYYDRNYYKIDFALNGGEGVSGIYVQFGADLTHLTDAMTTPTRAGYTFTGWYTDEACTQKFEGSFPTTMPAYDSTYYAGWSAGDTNYSVVVWVERLTEGEYDALCTFTLPAMTGDTVGYTSDAVSAALGSIQNDGTYEGYQATLKYFTLYGEKSDTDVTVSGDGATAVNVYYTRNSYTLRFVYGRSYTQQGWGGTVTVYQMSSSNHGYSLHQLPSGGGMTGFTLTDGCAWGVGVSQSGFTIASDYQDIIDANPTVLKTGTMEEAGKDTTYTYYYIDLTAKYGENIFDYWPQAGCVSLNGSEVIDWGTQYDSDYRKTYAADGSANAEPNIHPYYRVMDELLINTDNRQTADKGVTHTLVAYASGNTLFTWEYTPYYEALQSEIDDNSITKYAYDGTQYVMGTPVMVYTTQTDHSVEYVSVVPNDGFVTPSKDTNTLVAGEKTEDGETIYTLALYYKRERYSITFHNGYWGTKTVDGIPYGETLAGYTGTATVQYTKNDGSTETLADETFLLSEAEPLLANRIDPNFEAKYEFGGTWYTAWSETAGSGYGEVFDLTDETVAMPKNNLILYPAWEPRTYTATFFWESPDSKTEGAGAVYDPVNDLGLDPDTVAGVPTQTFAYGDTLVAPTPDPAYGSLEFLYWTYYVFIRDYEATDGSRLRFSAGDYLHFPSTLNLTIVNQIINGLLALDDCPIKEQRLEFGTTVFYDDVYIYGNWNDVVYVPYTVRYVLLNANVSEDTVVDHFDEAGVAYDADGEPVGVKIADDTTDSRFANTTVTLTAKTGGELYQQYQGVDENGLACYPVGSSTHSLTMDITQGNLEYTFLYKKGNPVTYRVQCLTAELDENGEAVKDENGKVKYVSMPGEYPMDINSTQAIITVDAPTWPGYTLMSDPATGQRDYQITRTLSHADPIVDENNQITGSEITEANTITFYYVKDEKAQEYTIEHYCQQMDGSYVLYTDMTYPGTVGETYTAQPLGIAGWWLDKSVEGTIASGNLTAGEALTLKLYYSAYPVQIKKAWASTVPTAQQKEVTVSVYLAQKQSGSSTYAGERYTDGSMRGNIVLNAQNEWTRTVYLPFLEEVVEDPDDPDAGEIRPLEDSFYVVAEEKALENGYVASYTDGVEIFVGGDKRTGGRVSLTKPAEDAEGNAAATAVVSTITNSEHFELPETGGVGTAAFTAGGTILLAGGLLCGYALRRRRERRRRR